MIRLGNEGLIIEIIIRESSGAKIESHKFLVSDKNKTRGILNMLKKKYGLNDFSKKDIDMDWLN